MSVSLNQFTKRRNELKRKERPAQSILEVNEFVESMMAEGVEVPRHGLNSSLRICRDSTFGGEQIKHVYLRGAAGTGKTVLFFGADRTVFTECRQACSVHSAYQ